MTYALGRRVEYTDMPAIRAIVRDAGEERQPHLGVHPRRRQQRRVPDGEAGDTHLLDHGRQRGEAVNVRSTTVEESECSSPTRTISRRTVLKGIGVTMALPLLEAMVPARTVFAQGAADAKKLRFVAIEMVHGAAGSAPIGVAEEPVVAGGDRQRLRPEPELAEPARAVPRLPDHRQQHRRAQRRSVHRAGNRRRSLPLERGVPDPVASASRRRARTCTPAPRSIRSTRKKLGQDTPIPSMQLCIENVDQSGGCSYGYSCAYTDSISWASPEQPLPMIRDPRVGVRSAVRRRRDAGRAQGAPHRGSQHPRLAAARRSAGMQKDLGAADRARLERLPRRRARDRAPHPEDRGAQQQRRAARAAGRADRRAGLVRRARQADVRPAGAGLRVGHHARVRVQAGPRRLEPRLSRRAATRARSTPASHHQEKRRAHPRLREDQQVPRQHGSVFPREAEEHAGRRRQPARQHAGALRIADGRLERAQPQARARCSSPATPAARSRATCTSRRPTARRWPTRC